MQQISQATQVTASVTELVQLVKTQVAADPQRIVAGEVQTRVNAMLAKAKAQLIRGQH